MPAHYTFLPWFRRGLINLAEAGSLSASGPMALHLTLQARGQGEIPLPVPQQVELIGPGQVSGLDPRAVVRTMPAAGVRNFEYNYLCAIEFYDEDLPWRYTPQLPEAGQLAPWLWLVVLSQEEFVRRAATSGSLGAIELGPGALATAFPDPATTWAWAHTHLNFQVNGATPGDSRQQVAGRLQQDPNLGCSRLICPRRLRPATAYTAFLVPAFEKGRLAGLGQEEALIAATPNAAPAWGAGQKVFPVYYEWSFATQQGGDFESLASLLSPLSGEEALALSGSQARRQLDIRKPGWGLAYAGPTGTMALESALRPLLQASDPPLPDRGGTEDEAFVASLAGLLNLGAGTLEAGSAAGQSPNPFFPGDNLEDDPIIVPPLYGSFYRGPGQVGGPAKGPLTVNPAKPVTDWYNQLNLNPALRVGASQGTTVVQQNQEKYMDQAWDQLSRNYESQRLAKRWDYSLEASESLFKKRLLPILEQAQPGDNSEDTFLALAFMAPMYQKLLLGNTSFTATVRQKPLPAAYSRSFTKLIRNGGPLVRRLNKEQGRGFFFEETKATPPPKNVLFSSVTALIEFLEHLARIRIFPPAHRQKDLALKRQGLAGYVPCKSALIALQPYLQVVGISILIRPSNTALYRSVASQISPRNTLSARLQALLPAVPGLTGGYPVFSEAMYAPLAAQSPDHILPGLDLIPSNRVALLETNAAFIESYLVGLNHELSREYLWREFPAPLDTTAFPQFWDTRDSPAATGGGDITPIGTWGTSTLGTHPPSGKVAEKMVLLVRGELLQKYPYTEVFLQKAGVADGQVRYPLFSARLDPDLRFIGFDLTPAAALGEGSDPGWHVVLKERAGEVHFGLDLDASATDPSWEALGDQVPEHSCLDVQAAAFQALPRYGGARADQVAAMLYQKPFMLLVPARRLVPQE
ncbi:MAG: hypothetical protein ACO1O1_10275 [Adhaeribacter sp.]